MSKKQGQRKRRKKAARKRTRDKSTAYLLAALAESLNACERRGLRVRFAHGAAFCDQGVVLPPVKKGQSWEARPFRDRPDARQSHGHDDD